MALSIVSVPQDQLAHSVSKQLEKPGACQLLSEDVLAE